MEITFEQIGLLFQISGVLIVLFSQVWLGYRAWRKYGSLKKAFFQMVSVIRVRDERKVTERSEEDLKKTFPEWWTFAEYLSSDLWTTGIGLAITLIGLIISMFEGSIVIPQLQV